MNRFSFHAHDLKLQLCQVLCLQLVSNNLVYQSDTGASVRPAVHVVTCILSATAAAFLEIGPQDLNIDDNY